MTNTELLKFLSQYHEDKIILVKLDYYTGTGFDSGYFSWGGFTPKLSDSITKPFLEVIKEIPTINRGVSNIFDEKISYSFGELVLWNLNNELDYLKNYFFQYRDITIYIGRKEDSFDNFNIIFSGTINSEGLKEGDNVLSFTFFDKQLLLEVPVAPFKYDTTEIEGQNKPTCLGYCFNVQPVLIDKINLEYQLDAFNVYEILEVRVNGNPTTQYKIGETGDVRKYIDKGTFRLTSHPATSTITVDVRGRSVDSTTLLPNPNDTPIDTASDLIKHLLILNTKIPNSQLDSSSFSTHKTNHPEKVGFWTTDSTVNEIIQQLTKSVNSLFYFVDNTFYLTDFELPTELDVPAVTITDSDIGFNTIEIFRTIPPAKKITVNYKKNNSIQKTGLAGTVIENNPDLVELYGREYSAVYTDNALVNDNILTITWLSGNTLRITFENNITTLNIVGKILDISNVVYPTNKGEFIISAQGVDYVDIININVSDSSFDETRGSGVVFSSPALQNDYTINTLLYEKTDADSLNTELASIYETKLKFYKLNKVFGLNFSINVGDIIKVNDINMLVLKVNDDYKQGIGIIQAVTKL